MTNKDKSAPTVSSKSKQPAETRAGAQLGFYFDQNRCIDCATCIVACKDWHDVPAGPASWMRVHRQEEGRFPDLSATFLAQPCYHCAQPICSWVCPAEAITKREEDGVVVVDREKCREESRCGIISEETMGPQFSFGEAAAPCQVSCPAHLYIPGYIALIAKGKFAEALSLIRRNMPLPSICGRVCLAPCEQDCRRQEVEEPVAIDALKRFVTDYVVEDLPSALPRTKPDKVAIVGSGPAGLAAAYDLIRKGYGVTIYEAMPEAGGMVAMGIPPFRLPKDVLKRDIDYIKALGVEIKTGTPVGPELTLDDLLADGYGAVLLAVGAWVGQKLGIAGADLDGTMVATAFMCDFNLGKKVTVGKRVVVLGGGNVGMDCARAAVRLGAEEVHVVCLECREDMPAEASEIERTEEEGVIIRPSLTFNKILGDGGKVVGVECLGVRGFEFDGDGTPDIDIMEGTEQVFPADTVIFAVGQTPDLSGLVGGMVKAAESGTIAVDPETLLASRRGVFAAGDAVHGATSVIDAIADGQKAAFYIDRYLQGEGLKSHPVEAITAADIKVDIPTDVEKQERQRSPLLPVIERKHGSSEVVRGFTPEMAVAEAERCLNCAGHLCKDVCPYSAPQFALETNAKMQKCDLCLDRWAEGKKPICVAACPVYALDAGPLDELKTRYGECREAKGFTYAEEVEPSAVFKSR